MKIIYLFTTLFKRKKRKRVHLVEKENSFSLFYSSSVFVSKIIISTRLFFAMFSGESFGATGRISPYPDNENLSSFKSKLSMK